MLSIHLYVLQRLTALLMVPLVIGHLAIMIYAVQGGLTVEEILGRTRGSITWFLFYGTFVLAAAIHGAIGTRVLIHEWFGVGGRLLEGLMWSTGTGLLVLGARAVWAVTFA